jgi:hypothetical protein
MDCQKSYARTGIPSAAMQGTGQSMPPPLSRLVQISGLQ